MMEAKQLLKEKNFWFASILIIWAVGLKGRMMWVQRQDSFNQKPGDLNQDNDSDALK